MTGPQDGAAGLEQDAAAWDRFVAASATPSYLQLGAWAAIKRSNGWSPFRVAVDTPGGPMGGQVLVQRRPGVPWGMGYLARGPVTADGSLPPGPLDTFTARVRTVAAQHRLGYVRMEPEAADSPELRAALLALGWVARPHVQPDRTRIIDLAQEPAAILAGMHRKCRQSISKSERLGVRVVEADGGRLGDFYGIHADAMRRAGISPRSERTYREMWQQLAPGGMARLLFAEASDTGEAIATLFLVSCGRRAVDLYGGTTIEGGRRRANYLLKWEAILRSRAAGLTEYDLWGLPRAGIEQFKTGFGGREIDYVGAWDLTISRTGAAVLQAGTGLYERARRWRYRKVHRPDAPDDGDGGPFSANVD